MNVETLDYGSEAWVEEAISNGKRRHQNTKCFNCRLGHLRRDCRQRIPRNNASLGMAEIGGLSLQVYVGGLAKVNTGPMNEGQ